MGFYIRKAVKLGMLRLNFSKSGLGLSAGVKGLRLGSGPRGNYIHAGRHGLYYRKSLGGRGLCQRSSSRNSSSAPASSESSSTWQPPDVDMQAITSASSTQLVDGSSEQLLEELNEARNRHRRWPVAVVLAIVLMFFIALMDLPGWAMTTLVVLMAMGCLWVWHQDQVRRITAILYDLEPEVHQDYEHLHDAFSQLRACNKYWSIDAHGQIDNQKYHGGAHETWDRSPLALKFGSLPHVKFNLDVLLLVAAGTTIAFLPDRLLVVDANGVGAVSYASLSIDCTRQQVIEHKTLPRDATVVRQTWQYTNKNGSPDGRFKNNPPIPVCAYDRLHLTSPTGLNLLVQFSKQDVVRPFADALQEMAKLKTHEPLVTN